MAHVSHRSALAGSHSPVRRFRRTDFGLKTYPARALPETSAAPVATPTSAESLKLERADGRTDGKKRHPRRVSIERRVRVGVLLLAPNSAANNDDTPNNDEAEGLAQARPIISELLHSSIRLLARLLSDAKDPNRLT